MMKIRDRSSYNMKTNSLKVGVAIQIFVKHALRQKML